VVLVAHRVHKVCPVSQEQVGCLEQLLLGLLEQQEPVELLESAELLELVELVVFLGFLEQVESVEPLESVEHLELVVPVVYPGYLEPLELQEQVVPLLIWVLQVGHKLQELCTLVVIHFGVSNRWFRWLVDTTVLSYLNTFLKALKVI
jgi:hypothetical protein